MTMPFILRLQSAMTGSVDSTLWGLITGITLQIMGLVLESAADYQKASFKAIDGNRRRWCNIGLYRFLLFPNYLGEGLFWIGTFISSITCYNSFVEWAISIVGLTFILSILHQAMSSLDEKHSKKYGG
jgi:steroid 5-alpha reductase family enzyme